MKEMNSFLMTDSERELIRRPMSEILAEMARRFEDGLKKARRENGMTEVTPKLAHSCILAAEGRKLSETHPEYGRKLIVASIFWQNMDGLDVLNEKEMKLMPEWVQEMMKERNRQASEV